MPKITICKKNTAAENPAKGRRASDLNQKLLAQKPIIYSVLTWTSTGKTPRERLISRTRELAFLSGCGPLGITQANYDQAKREVTNELYLVRDFSAFCRAPWLY